jgi:hypothetical protein
LIIEIGIKVHGKTSVLLQDSISAQPRVYIEGQPPPSVTEKFYNASEIDALLQNYATKVYVDEAIKNVDVDLTGYATETYVDEKISEIKVSESVDLSNYVGDISLVKTVDDQTQNTLVSNDEGLILGDSKSKTTIQGNDILIKGKGDVVNPHIKFTYSNTNTDSLIEIGNNKGFVAL